MASPIKKEFAVGEAPWEKKGAPKEFAVGSAPWEQEEEERPLVTGKGLLKGALESLPMAGSMVGGALGFASPLPGGTIVGAGLGGGAGKALQNIGEKYLLGEDKTREQIYADPALATLEGTTAEMGGQLIAPVAKAAGKGLKSLAETQAFKSSGAMLKDFRQAAAKDQVKEIGRFMIDNKIVKAGDSFADVAAKAEAIKSNAGKKLNDIYTRVSEAIPNITKRETGFNPVRDKEEIISSVKKAMGNEVGARNALNQVDAYLDDLAQTYGDVALDPSTANDIKGAIDRTINYSRNPMNKQPDAEKAFSATRRILEKRIAADVDFIGEQLGSEDLSKALRAANKEYGTSANIYNIADDRVQRESANRMFGLTDTIAGGAGTTVGAVVGGGAPGAIAGGMLAAGANKLGRKYGPGMLSGGSDLVSKGLLKASKSKTLRQLPKGLIGGDSGR